VVAHTMRCNHLPLNGYLIGAHEYEAHYVFDIWYRNTSDIVPTVITGDMHSVNKANFAVLYCFGLRFEPRFTNFNDQLKQLYCTDDLALYEKYLIGSVGQVHLSLIMDEKPNMDQVVVTLRFKEMTQGTLIRKLCTYTATSPMRLRSLNLTRSHVASARYVACAIPNLIEMRVVRIIGLSHTTSYVRRSTKSVAKRS
jgi:TnpA family transposase